MKDFVQLQEENAKLQRTNGRLRKQNAKLTEQFEQYRGEIGRLRNRELNALKRADANPFGELKMPIPSVHDLASFVMVATIFAIIIGYIALAFGRLPTRIIG